MRSGVFVRVGDVVNALRNKRNVLKGKVPEPSRWTAWMRAASMAIATAGAMAASASFAASTTVSVLIDADNNASTGCTVSTANGPFAGVERVLNTTVIADATGYRIQSITLQSCNGGAIGPATIISATPTPLVRGSGANGTTAVETYIPSSFLPATGQKMRVAVTSVGADGLVGSDALTVTAAGNAILVDGPPLVVVPTLAKLSLALTALLLALSVWFARRRGWNGMQLVIVAAFAVSMSSQLIAAVALDGLKISWTGIAPVATDPAGDAPKGSDFTNLFSTVDSGNVYFRIDVDLNSPPVANAQSVTAVVGQGLPITLTGSDFEASPLTFAVITSPTQGVLSGTAPNLTYTPNAGAGVSDSFTFRANDGSADSAPATVSIDIKRPPTITSVNNATFIPGQANSFTFTATGVPSSNFTLTACNTALPPTIAITNNGNNTGTLAGNPTVAQGGTYVCTLTASNGFGSNATQQFTLNLGLPPTFTSANSTTFTTGAAGTFTVTTTATPPTTSIAQTGSLPSGVTFAYASGLTATLAGTPAAGTGGTYPITLTAGNGIPPNSTQSFTLTVNQAPAVTSANSLTCIVGVACSLPITATGFPLPTIAIGGAALPGGIAYAAGTPGNGTLSGTPTAGGVGTYSLTFTASSSTTPNAVQNFTLTVNKAATTTALASSLNPSISGQPVTFTATVTPQGAGVPTGTVTFNDGATAICSNVAVNGSGVATCTSSALTVAASPHSMTAVYAGDTSFSTSTSVAVSQVVTKANATTALASSVNPSNFGQSVTFTATVTAVAPASGTPTGTVTFNDGAAALCSNVPVNGAGTATCTTAALSTAASPHSVTAIYGGDASFNASPASTAISQVVNKAATTTALASGTNPSVSGQSVTFTATVSVTPPGLGTPTGTINFTDGAATVCANVAISGAGIATCTTSTLTAGAAHSITASYGGDASFNSSASSVLSQTVNKASSTTALASGANPSASGQPVTFTATVAPVAPGGGTLTGTVAFNDGATVVCAAAAVSSGVATCTTSALSATGSPHSMTATYSGDSNFNGSASAALSQVVNKANSASTVTSSKTPTVAGESVTFTAAVAPVAPGTGVPSGTVTFNDGATPICSNVALVAGGATCATTALSVTSHTITVAYSGDASFNISTSPAITQVVGLAGTTTALTTSGSPSTAGNNVTFTATVSPVAPATGTPTGTVTFNDGATPICVNVALVTGSATCSTTALSVGSHSITAVYSGSVGFATSTSANLTQAVNPGPATQFTVSAPSSAVSGTAFNVTVTAKDALNNVATGYRGTAHFTSTDGAATLPTDYTFTAGDNGVHIFTSGATLRTAGSRTITATDTVTASITGASSAINVGAAGATNFVISGTPTTTTAGIALSYTVTARDASNNVATGYVGTVNFTSTDGAATLPVNYAFTGGDAGVHTFANGATLRTAGAHAITATDMVTASITGTSASITVNAAATSTYAISAPGTAVSGTPISVTVTAQDAFGNTTTSYGGTVHFTSSDPAATLPADSTLTAGFGTFAATLRTAGTRTITATDSVTAAINKTSGAINVSAGAAAKLAFAQQPTTTGSGAPITPAVTVQIQDAAGNQVNSSASVTLAIGANPGGGTLSGTATVAASGGVATFSGLSIDKLGVGYTLVASSVALTSATSGAFNIAAGAATKLAFVQQPTNSTSGAAIAPAVTVQIQDAAGNLVNSAANVTLAIGANPGGGTLSGTATVAASGGVATFSGLSIDKAGVGYTVVASSGALTSATSGAFNVAAGAAAKLAFVQQPSNTTSGAAIAPAMTVQIQDAAGNLVNSAANVTLAIGANPGGGTLSGTATVAASGGVATFSGLSIDKAGVGYTVVASSGALTSATSGAFNIAAGAATKLAFVQQPTNSTSGAAIAPAITVQIQDAVGNLVNSSASVTLAIGTNPGGATLSGTATVAAVGGVATFSGLSIDKLGVGYTLVASSGALTSATSAAFNIAVGAAAKLAFIQQPTNSTSGAVIAPAMTVQIQDAAGNLVNSAANVTLAIGTNPGSGTLSGTATVAAVGGVATFNNLNIDKAGTGYTLVASSGALTSATSGAFNIAAGASTKLAFVQQPTSAASGVAIAPAMTVQIQDAAGNLVNSAASVTLAIGTNPAGGTLSGTATVAASGGVATFSGLNIDKAGTGYRLAATSGALTSATSALFNITPGAATHFSVVAPASATGAVPFNFTVTALDAANNTATGYVGTAHFTSTDVAPVLPANYTFVAVDSGVKSFSATLTTNGAQTITATDTVTASITGTSNAIAVSTGPAITSPNSATFLSGTNSTFTITTTGTPTVNSITLTGCTLQTGLTFLYVSGSTATISGNASATGTVSCTVTASNGVPPAGTQTLTVTVNKSPTISAISNSTFSVGVAGSGTFTVTGFPAPMLTLSGCTLPSGLSLVGNQITGTPNVGAATVNGCIVTAANGILPDASTAPFTVTISIPPPTVTTSGGTTAFTEDLPAVVVDNSLTVTQTGGTNLASGTVAISGGTFVSGQDVLAFTNQNGITGSYSLGTGVLTLTGSSSLANYQTALRSITYNNTSQNPSTANRTVQFVVNDGSASSTPATKTVSVTAVNDAPVLANGSTLNYTENGAPAVINAVITVSDIDSPNLVGATVAVTAGYVNGQDVLSYATALGITGSFNSGTGVLTLSGTTTVANYQTALQNVKYSNLSNDPSNGVAVTTSRTISYQVNDGGAVNNLSNVVTSTVNVTAVNNPPIATALSGLYAQAGIPITYPAGTLGGTDVEAGTTVTVVTTPDSVCASCQLTINANGGFTFTPPPSAAGTTASFTYHVMDNGNPAPGVTGTSVTVSFTVSGPAIYFVKSAAVGLGNCNLGSECTLATAVTNIGASTNARIFLNDSNPHSGGVSLNSGGWLVGLGTTGTTFDALFGIAPSGTGTLATRPTLGATRPTVQGTVSLNTNSTVRGLNLSTGAATGMNDPAAAITGVTVSEVSVTTTTGTAVNLNGTGGTLTFTSISSNGAANGISLTSTTGSFTVTGTGGTCTVATPTCSGGSIQSSTGAGILIATSAQSINLNSMKIQNSGTRGIQTTGVNGFTLDNSIVTDSAGTATDDGLNMANTSGTLTISNSAIANAPHNGMTVDNFNTNMTAFNFTNNTISCAAGQPCQPSGSIGNDGLLLVMRGTSVLPSGVVSGSTFSGVRAVGVQIQTNDTGRIGVNSGAPGTFALTTGNSFVVQNNTFTGNGQGIDMGTSQVSNMTFQVLNNTIVGKLTSPGAIANTASSHAINAFTAAGAATGPAVHSFVGKIDGNIIGTQGVKDSGAGFGAGVRVVVQGQTTQGVVTVSNNTIRETPNATMLDFFGQNGAAVAGTLAARFKITNNTMPAPSGSNLSLCGPANTACADNGIFVLADQASPVCNSITGNTIYDLSTMNGAFDIFLAERIGPPAGAQLTVEGTGGSNSAFIQANNTLAGAQKFVDEGANTSQVAISACGTFP